MKTIRLRRSPRNWLLWAGLVAGSLAHAAPPDSTELLATRNIVSVVLHGEDARQLHTLLRGAIPDPASSGSEDWEVLAGSKELTLDFAIACHRTQALCQIVLLKQRLEKHYYSDFSLDFTTYLALNWGGGFTPAEAVRKAAIQKFGTFFSNLGKNAKGLSLVRHVIPADALHFEEIIFESRDRNFRFRCRKDTDMKDDLLSYQEALSDCELHALARPLDDAGKVTRSINLVYDGSGEKKVEATLTSPADREQLSALLKTQYKAPLKVTKREDRGQYSIWEVARRLELPFGVVSCGKTVQADAPPPPEDAHEFCEIQVDSEHALSSPKEPRYLISLAHPTLLNPFKTYDSAFSITCDAEASSEGCRLNLGLY